MQQQVIGKFNSLKKCGKSDAEESRFWNNIWDSGNSHDQKSSTEEKIQSMKKQVKLDDIHIATEMFTQYIRKVPNWKHPGSDGVQRYWLNIFQALPE